MLIFARADVNRLHEPSKETPLISATRRSDATIVELLLGHGADTAVVFNGVPLHNWARSHCRSFTVVELLERFIPADQLKPAVTESSASSNEYGQNAAELQDLYQAKRALIGASPTYPLLAHDRQPSWEVQPVLQSPIPTAASLQSPHVLQTCASDNKLARKSRDDPLGHLSSPRATQEQLQEIRQKSEAALETLKRELDQAAQEAPIQGKQTAESANRPNADPSLYRGRLAVPEPPNQSAETSTRNAPVPKLSLAGATALQNQDNAASSVVQPKGFTSTHNIGGNGQTQAPTQKPAVTYDDELAAKGICTVCQQPVFPNQPRFKDGKKNYLHEACYLSKFFGSTAENDSASGVKPPVISNGKAKAFDIPINTPRLPEGLNGPAYPASQPIVTPRKTVANSPASSTLVTASLENIDVRHAQVVRTAIVSADGQRSGGLGLSFIINEEGYPIVEAMAVGGSASLSGKVREGDMVISVDGVECKGKRAEDVIQLIKGQVGSQANLLLKNAGSKAIGQSPHSRLTPQVTPEGRYGPYAGRGRRSVEQDVFLEHRLYQLDPIPQDEPMRPIDLGQKGVDYAESTRASAPEQVTITREGMSTLVSSNFAENPSRTLPHDNAIMEPRNTVLPQKQHTQPSRSPEVRHVRQPTQQQDVHQSAGETGGKIDRLLPDPEKLLPPGQAHQFRGQVQLNLPEAGLAEQVEQDLMDADSNRTSSVLLSPILTPEVQSPNATGNDAAQLEQHLAQGAISTSQSVPESPAVHNGHGHGLSDTNSGNAETKTKEVETMSSGQPSLESCQPARTVDAQLNNDNANTKNTIAKEDEDRGLRATGQDASSSGGVDVDKGSHDRVRKEVFGNGNLHAKTQHGNQTDYRTPDAGTDQSEQQRQAYEQGKPAVSSPLSLEEPLSEGSHPMRDLAPIAEGWREEEGDSPDKSPNKVGSEQIVRGVGTLFQGESEKSEEVAQENKQGTSKMSVGSRTQLDQQQHDPSPSKERETVSNPSFGFQAAISSTVDESSLKEIATGSKGRPSPDTGQTSTDLSGPPPKSKVLALMQNFEKQQSQSPTQSPNLSSPSYNIPNKPQTKKPPSTTTATQSAVQDGQDNASKTTTFPVQAPAKDKTPVLPDYTPADNTAFDDQQPGPDSEPAVQPRSDNEAQSKSVRPKRQGSIGTGDSGRKNNSVLIARQNYQAK